MQFAVRGYTSTWIIHQDEKWNAAHIHCHGFSSAGLCFSMSCSDKPPPAHVCDGETQTECTLMQHVLQVKLYENKY